MKTHNTDGVHQIDVTRGRKNTNRAGSRGIDVLDASTEVSPVTTLQFPDFVVTDGDDGVAIVTFGGASGEGTPSWINPVTDYGADPTGATDSTLAIQAANDALCATGGGVLYAPKGRYLISSETSGQRYGIHLCSNVTLQGDGMFLTTFVYDPAQTLPAGTVYIPIEIGTGSVGVENVTVRDIAIEANHTALGGGFSAPLIQGIAARTTDDDEEHCDDVLIQRVRVYDSNAGISCVKDASGAPTHTAFRHRRWAVRDCLVDTTTNKGIELDSAEDVEITGNTCVDVMDGIQLLYYTTRARILGNSITYMNGGINVREGSTDVEVGDNILRCIGGGSSTLSDLPAGIALGTEGGGVAAVAMGRVFIHDNIVIDQTSTLKIGLMFASYTHNTTATISDVWITRNFFYADTVYLTDATFPAKSVAGRLRVVDNYFNGTVTTNASWVSDRTRFERNHVISNFTAASNNWDFRGNTFGGTFTISGTGCTLDDGYVRNVLVSAVAPSAGQILTATSATAAEWDDRGDLDDLSDVTVTAAVEGELLRWNGSAWVNDAGYICVDAGTPTYDTGSPPAITMTTDWGIAAGLPYYDDAGADAGEEAALFYDPLNDHYFLMAYDF